VAGLFAVCRFDPHDPRAAPGALREDLARLLSLRPLVGPERCTTEATTGIAIAVVVPFGTEGVAALASRTFSLRAEGGEATALLAAGGAREGFARLDADPTAARIDWAPVPYVAFRFARGKLVVSLDELGAWPLYARWLAPSVLVLGTSALALARFPPRASVDARGAAELLFFGQLLGRRTLYESVHAFPPGARFVFDAEGAREERFLPPDAPITRPLDATARRIQDALDAAIDEADLPLATEPQGLLLSGGVDSRLVVGTLRARAIPVRALTFGDPASPDVRGATRIARALALEHEIARLEPAAFLEVLESAVLLTDGHVPAVHAHGFDLLTALARKVTIQWNGFAGDALLGGSFAHPRYALPGNAAERLFRAFSGGAARRLRALFDEDAAREIAVHARASFFEAFDSTSGAPSERIRRFLLDQRVARLAATGLALDRHHMTVLTPFAHASVRRVMHELTPGERRFGRALCRTVVRHHPKLAGIPWQRTGAPPSAAWPIAAATRAAWRAAARMRLARPRGFVDYDAWFAEPLHPLVLDTLARRQVASWPVTREPGVLARALSAGLIGGLVSLRFATDRLEEAPPPAR